MLPSAPSARDLGATARRRSATGAASVRNTVTSRALDLGGVVRVSQAGPATGLIAQLLLLALLAGTAGLGPAGWLVGVACAATVAATLARGLARGPGAGLGPASWVTLVRATLAIGVAALVAASFTDDTPVALLVTLSAVALALDLVDGWLA